MLTLMIWVYTVCRALSVQKLRNITVLLNSAKLPNRYWAKTKRLQTTHYFYKYMDRVKRIWYLSSMRAAKVQASSLARTSLLAHRSSESRGTFRQKVRSLAPVNGWACAVKICHDGILEDTNSLDGAHIYRHSHHKFCDMLTTWGWIISIQCSILWNTKSKFEKVTTISHKALIHTR